jgi:hypothetical protein
VVLLLVLLLLLLLRSWWNRHVQNPIKFHGYQGRCQLTVAAVLGGWQLVPVTLQYIVYKQFVIAAADSL